MSPNLTRSVNKNVGASDRTIRTALGAVFGLVSLAVLAGTGSLPMILAPVFGVIAIIMLGTAAAGTCGVYALIGVDTCSAGLEN